MRCYLVSQFTQIKISMTDQSCFLLGSCPQLWYVIFSFLMDALFYSTCPPKIPRPWDFPPPELAPIAKPAPIGSQTPVDSNLPTSDKPESAPVTSPLPLSVPAEPPAPPIAQMSSPSVTAVENASDPVIQSALLTGSVPIPAVSGTPVAAVPAASPVASS